MQTIIVEARRIDVLVNNVGYSHNGAFEDIALEELKAQVRNQSIWCYKSNPSGLPIMRKQKSGIIVNISSGVVTIGGLPGGSAYVNVNMYKFRWFISFS
jgi:short-subunit dehydrogenase